MRVLAFLVLLLAAAGSAAAQQRLALVIGNDVYANLGPDEQLQKAVNDANAVGDALERIGFEVIRGANLGRAEMLEKLEALAARLAPEDTAFVFFAGHGVAIDGANYLLPSDVPAGGSERLIRQAAIAEAAVIEALREQSVKVGVVVLDACRDNPFKGAGTRSVGATRGLARPPEEPRGIFGIYSAGIGQTALDRLGEDDPNPNSVFTRVLAPALTQEGTSLIDVAYEVRDEVERLARSVGHEQTPGYYDQARGRDIYLAGRLDDREIAVVPDPALAAHAASAATIPSADPCAGAEAHFRFAVDLNGREAFEDHLRRFPACTFSDLAKTYLARLDAEASPAPVTPEPVEPKAGDTADAPAGEATDTTAGQESDAPSGEGTGTAAEEVAALGTAETAGEEAEAAPVDTEAARAECLRLTGGEHGWLLARFGPDLPFAIPKARAACRAAAEAGDAAVLLRLALVEESFAEADAANALVSRAVEAGDPIASMLSGQGDQEATGAALAQAAEADATFATVLDAKRYISSELPSDEYTPERARAIVDGLRGAAENGDVTVAYFAARIIGEARKHDLVGGIEEPADAAQAMIDVLRTADDNLDVLAAYLLEGPALEPALFGLDAGDKTSEEAVQESRDAMRRAAALGHAGAAQRLAWELSESDPAEALRYAHLAARAGMVNAEGDAASLREKIPDLAALVAACDAAAAHPDDAQKPEGIEGLSGEAMRPSQAVAACETALAAEPENPRILYQLGRALAEDQRPENAIPYLEEAAEAGYAIAAETLGRLHAEGSGNLEQDMEAAGRWYERAATLGSATAAGKARRLVP